MPLNWKLISIGMLVVFIAVILLLFVVEYIAREKDKCETNKNLEICKLGALEIVIMILMLIGGGFVIVIAVTAYILISGQTEV
jgi:hypothetical protein